MKLSLRNLFGPRIVEDPKEEAETVRELRDTLVKHELTLRSVQDVLSDSESRVAVAIDETGDAIRHTRRKRNR